MYSFAIIVAVVLHIARQGIFFPVHTGTGLVHVLDGRNEILMNPWVIGILDTVLLAHFANFRGNVGVPTRRHARKQVMFDLKVETTSKVSGNGTTVRAGCFDLTLEPAHLLSTRRGLAALGIQHVGRITIGVNKVVTEAKQNGE